jgi:hypothetical protein
MRSAKIQKIMNSEQRVANNGAKRGKALYAEPKPGAAKVLLWHNGFYFITFTFCLLAVFIDEND